MRLFKLQIIDYSFYSALASDQHEIYLTLVPKRGEILVADYNSDQLYPLATSRDFNFIFGIPVEIDNPAETTEILTELLRLDEEEAELLLVKLSKENDPYEPIKHKVTDEIVEQIKEKELTGIRFVKESWRYYPMESLSSQLIGFVGFEGDQQRGLYGLEGYFDEELSGQPGVLETERDVAGRWIALTEKKVEKAEDGSDIILTIDRTVQYYVCDLLNKTALRHGADGGSVIIMNPATGSITAMCNYPDFDPNNYSEVDDPQFYNNPAIFSEYEPGSIFKPITMAGALDAGLLTPGSTYTDTGQRQVDIYTISNSDGKTHGQQTMTEVLENSLNLGVMFVAEELGTELFRQYVQNFGFGQPTGISLPAEADGNISSLNNKAFVYSATASFGQGITVTPLQMVTAFGAIANGGRLMKPYVIDEIRHPSGQADKTSPQMIRQAISSRAATLLGGMLVSVVNNGHAKLAGVDGYYVGGKTGTAQVSSTVRAGYSGKTIHSFVGFAPVDDPAFVMLVKLDDPKDVPFAASSAAPLFGEIARFLLNYYQIPPDY